MSLELTTKQAAQLISAEVKGDGSAVIKGVGDIRAARPDDICFVASEKYLDGFKKSSARYWLVTKDFYEKTLDPLVREGKTFLIHEHPFLGFVKLANHFFPQPKAKGGVHPQASVDPTAQVHPEAQIHALACVGPRTKIGAGSIIHPGVWLGADCVVGENTQLFGNVSVYPRTQIGSRCLIHSGVVLGADGFGFVKDSDGKQVKVPHLGRVVIHDDVEIGANSCVDKGTLGDTIIGRGVKLDDFVMLAHNCEVGENSIICGMSGSAGSTKIGSNVLIAAGTHITDHVVIGNNTVIGGNSGVTKDVPANSNLKGYPLRPVQETLKIQTLTLKLPEIYKRLQNLEEKLRNESE